MFHVNIQLLLATQISIADRGRDQIRSVCLIYDFIVATVSETPSIRVMPAFAVYLNYVLQGPGFSLLRISPDEGPAV